MNATWRLVSGLDGCMPLYEALERLTTTERMLRSSAFLDLYGQINARFSDVSCPVVQFVGPEGHEGSAALAWELAYWVATIGARNVLFLHADGSPIVMPPLLSRKPVGRRAVPPDPPSGAADLSASGSDTEDSTPLLSSNGYDRFEHALLAADGEKIGRNLTLRTTPLEPARLLEPGTGESLLAAWRREFDLVVIESPPVTKAAMCLPVAQRVDGVFLVVRAEHTPALIAEAAKRSLEGVGASVLGVVLNTNRRL